MVNINRKELSLDIRSELDASRQHLINNTSKEVTLNKDLNTINSKIKSPVNVKRIDGKTIVNLVPLFDSGAWTYQSGSEQNLPLTLLPNDAVFNINKSLTANIVFAAKLNLKPNTQYTLNMADTGFGSINTPNKLYASVDVYSVDNSIDTPNVDGGNSVGVTFTTNGQTSYYIRLLILQDTPINNVFTFRNISLVEGAQAQPFVANVKGLTNPTLVNETNNTSLVVPTTLYTGEYVEQNTKGELVKYKKYGEVLLDDKLVYTYFTSSANNTAKRINITAGLTGLKIDASLSDLKDHKLVKYNGMSLIHGSTTLADNFNNVDNQLAISIPNTDSGWGPNYIPTPDEMKAYFLGWIMYNAQTGLVYNNEDVQFKRWYPIGGNWETQNVKSVPETQVTISAKWKPHRLIYELATPIQEVIQPYSDLTLEKDDNNLKVYAGRIVNEFIVPKPSSDGLTFHINLNQTSNPAHSPLRYAVSKIKDIKSNIISDMGKWIPMYTVSNGSERYYVSKEQFKPTTSYTVDYEPLYTWEVTAPIDTAQITYFETLQAVASEIIKDLENIGARGSRSAKLISDLVSHTNELNPHAEMTSYTIRVGANQPFKTLQSAVDSIKKNMGGQSINIIVDPGYYAEFVRINGFRNGYISIYGEANNRLAVTVEHIRVSYCEATIVVNHVKVEANRDNGIFVANSMYTRIYNSAIVRSAAFAGTKYGIAGENSNVMIDSCDISAFEVAVHSAVGATVYVHQSTGANNKTGLACYGGAVIAKSGTMPGATITAESSWAGGVIR